MLLHLLRHAHAGDPRSWDGPDAARPLSDKGRDQADRLGRFLAGLRLHDRRSSSARPRSGHAQTAEIVAERAGRHGRPSTTGSAGAFDAEVARRHPARPRRPRPADPRRPRPGLQRPRRRPVRRRRDADAQGRVRADRGRSTAAGRPGDAALAASRRTRSHRSADRTRSVARRPGTAGRPGRSPAGCGRRRRSDPGRGS